MEFIGDIVRKTGESSMLAVEAEKASRAFEIGRDSGLFYVPKVAGLDTEAGVLEFERLDGLVTLHELSLRKDPRLFALLEKAGEALAVVHEKLVLPEEMKHEFPPEWMDSPDENVFVHGDFTLRNVCLRERSGDLVILDWSAAPLLGGTAVFGSRYFDVLWLVSHAFSSGPNRGLLGWDAQGIADAFIRGYTTAIKPKSLDKLRIYWPRFLRLHRKSVWYQATHRKSYKACVYVSSQAFLYYKLWRYGQKFS